MIRFYANQAGYLPKGRKIAVLAQENRADEMEKMQDKKVSLWNEKGEQTAVKQAVYAGVDESAEDKVWHIDFSDLTEEGTVTFQDGEGAVLGSCIIGRKAYHTLNQTLCKALYFQRCGMALLPRKTESASIINCFKVISPFSYISQSIFAPLCMALLNTFNCSSVPITCILSIGKRRTEPPGILILLFPRKIEAI